MPSSGTPTSPGMSPPKHGHGSPQLPLAGRDGSAAGRKFQQQILSCCFLLLTGRECCSLLCFPHVQERQNNAFKSLDTSHEPLVSLNPSLSSQLPGFLQYLLETCTKRTASLSMGFFLSHFRMHCVSHGNIPQPFQRHPGVSKDKTPKHKGMGGWQSP